MISLCFACWLGGRPGLVLVALGCLWLRVLARGGSARVLVGLSCAAWPEAMRRNTLIPGRRAESFGDGFCNG